MELDANFEHSSKEINGLQELKVRRTGKPVTLIYLGISEPETFRAMNEMLYLLTKPSLDSVFRNPDTGSLKSLFGLIVDNGHGEDPDSALTQMCMVRLLSLMQLNKVTQRSFAEYHSKRNFVERVHAAENDALSRRGAFCSSKIHKKSEPHSDEHFQNMEAMAEDVRQCISQARFGSNFVKCFRGVAQNVIFNDETSLKEFLTFSEEGKLECDWSYEPIKNEYLNTLVEAWNIDENYKGFYALDYQLITNQLERTTAYKDKYGTSLCNPDDTSDETTVQPIPDYIRWINSMGELHYLSYEKTEQLCEDTPDAFSSNDIFLPTRILNLFLDIDNNPPDDILNQLALLVWLPVEEVTTYFAENREKAEKSYHDNLGRETWRNHHLYKLKMNDLQQMCKKLNIPFKGQKYSIVKIITNVKGEKPPEDLVVDD